MAKHILEHSTDTLNISIDSFNTLHRQIRIAHALVYMSFSDQFVLADDVISQNYLEQLYEILEKAKFFLDNELNNKDNDELE